MSTSLPLRAASVSLDQLIALNDEIRALVRVGVPLEQGLSLIGKESPGRSGRLFQWVADRLQQGQSLEQILAAHPESFPPVYRAVVQAGIKSGNLASALEAVAASARRLAQTRRMIVSGLIYPLIVLLVAWQFFVFYTVRLAPGFLATVDDFGLPGRSFFARLAEWGQTAQYWGPAVPAVVLILVGVWWLFSGRASLADPGVARTLLGWVPGMRRILRNYQVATLADLLSLLVRHGVPFPESLVMAAEATGGQRLTRASRLIAEAIRRGERVGPHTEGMRQFPPLLVWMISGGEAQEALSGTLHQAAEVYYQRACYQAEAARVFVPVALTLAIGGVATVMYALLVLGSWFSVLNGLSYVS